MFTAGRGCDPRSLYQDAWGTSHRGIHGRPRPRREQKSPRLLRKMRALLFRRACCSRRGMFRRRFSAEAPPGLAPSRFPRLRFRRALGSEKPRYSFLPRCSAPGAPFMATTCGERPSAAYPAAPVRRQRPFRNNPVALLPFRLPLCLPRGGIVPHALRPCRACAEHTPFFAEKAFDFHRLRPSQHALPLSGIIPDKKERRPDIPLLQHGGITA